MPNTPSSQTTFFSSSTPRQAFYAELCNALYDKSIQELAETKLDATLLQQRLSSLTYHVNLATEKLFNVDSPLELDVHNGSWQGKQSSTLSLDKINVEKSIEWFQKYAEVGLNLPVYIGEKRVEFIELDAIDRIDTSNQTLRLNKNGWFHFNGQPVENVNTEAGVTSNIDSKTNTASHNANMVSAQSGSSNNPHIIKRQLLKPTKIFLTAAVCGHCWNYRGKTTPRRLSLRELLLSTSINWKHFRL